MVPKNDRVKRFQRIIAQLHEKLVKMKEILKIKEDKINHGKQEFDASLQLVADLGNDLPHGWLRSYDEDKKRFLYKHSKKKIHFWSDNVSNPEIDLGDNVSEAESDLDDLCKM